MIAIKNADGTLVPVSAGQAGSNRTVPLSLVHSNQKRAEIRLYQIDPVPPGVHPELEPGQEPFGVLVIKRLPENPFGEVEISATVEVDDDLNVSVRADVEGMKTVSGVFRLPRPEAQGAEGAPASHGINLIPDGSAADSGDTAWSADELPELDNLLGGHSSWEDDSSLAPPESLTAPSAEADDPFGGFDLDSEPAAAPAASMDDEADMALPSLDDDPFADLGLDAEPESAAASPAPSAEADDPFGGFDLDSEPAAAPAASLDDAADMALPSLDDDPFADLGLDAEPESAEASPALSAEADDPFGGFDLDIEPAAAPAASLDDAAAPEAPGSTGFIDDPDDTDWGFDELKDESDADGFAAPSTDGGLPDFDAGPALDLGSADDDDSFGIADLGGAAARPVRGTAVKAERSEPADDDVSFDEDDGFEPEPAAKARPVREKAKRPAAERPRRRAEADDAVSARPAMPGLVKASIALFAVSAVEVAAYLVLRFWVLP